MINGRNHSGETGLLEMLERSELLGEMLVNRTKSIRRELQVRFQLSQALTLDNLTVLENAVIDAAIRGEGRRAIQQVFFDWRKSVGLIDLVPLPEAKRNGHRVLQPTGESSDWLQML